MLRASGIILAWLIVGLGCANETVPFSAESRDAVGTEEENSAEAANTRVSDTPEAVDVEQIPAPKEWPACWLSSRLSSTEAVVKERDSNFTEKAGRQEFRGTSANPITSGDCIFNWFGQDNPKEPWVELIEQRLANSLYTYDSIVTCTADSTPDCTCMTSLPQNPDGDDPVDLRDNVPFIVGDCVRETDTGRLVIYNVRNPDQLGLQPANGRCDAAETDVATVLIEKRGEIASMEDDGDVTISNGHTCHVDIEPFNPRDDEKDWYGDEIRDWAVVKCEDASTSCRSYALFYKSGEDQGRRGSMTEQGLMLICNDGKCEQVWEQ